MLDFGRWNWFRAKGQRRKSFNKKWFQKKKMLEEKSFQDEKKKYLSSFFRGNMKNGHDLGIRVQVGIFDSHSCLYNWELNLCCLNRLRSMKPTWLANPSFRKKKRIFLFCFWGKFLEKHGDPDSQTQVLRVEVTATQKTNSKGRVRTNVHKCSGHDVSVSLTLWAGLSHQSSLRMAWPFVGKQPPHVV